MPAQGLLSWHPHNEAVLRRVAVLLLTMTIAVPLAGCAKGGSSKGYSFTGITSPGKTIAVADRKVAGKADGSLMNGSSFAVSSTAGNVTLLNFFASYCVPCQTETPNLIGLHNELKATGVRFVGVDVKDTKTAVQAFIDEMKIDYPVVYDQQARIPIQIGNIPMTGIPMTVLLDKQQRVAAVYTGGVLPADLRPVLAQLAAEPAA